MNWKKILSLCLALLLALPPAGCGGPDADRKDDQNTLTITLGIRNVEQLIEGLTAKFPDIDFDIEPTFCANPSGYLRQMLVTDHTGDIFYYSQKPDGAEAAAHLLDLSGYDFIGNFDRAIINSYMTDGRVYSIPGPLAIRGVAYNKTLFEQHGWRRPENHRELVELCRRIRAETDDITPIAMSLGGVAYPFTLVTILSQTGFLSTPAGEDWQRRFLAGEATAAEGWGQGLEMAAELIDAGAFNPGPYIGVWDDKALGMEFAEGKAAMFFMWAGQDAMLRMIDSHPDCEYAFMPFYGANEGERLIGVSPNFTWGLPKRLGEPGNEKKLENALRVMEWFSTPEGQALMRAMVTDENGVSSPSPAEMSPLNLPDTNRDSSRYFTELWELAEKGNKAPTLYSGYESVIVNAGTIVQDAMLAGSSAGMAERFTASVDADHRAYLAGGEAAVLGEITQDLTEEETAQLLAGALNDSGLGDFALATHTGRAGREIYNKYGAAARLFAGRLTNQDYNMVLGDLKDVQILTLTGAQVKDLLAGGKQVVSAGDESQSAAFPYYWSGLDVTLAKDGSVRSARLNGAELEEGRAYKVVFYNGDYTDAVAAAGQPADSGMAAADLWQAYLEKHSPISAPEVLRKQP